MDKKVKQALNPEQLECWGRELFPGLEFEEDNHIYHVDGVQMPSVSTVLKNFYDEFPVEFMAKNYAKKHGFRVKDVKNAWAGKSKLSADRGTLVHEFGENLAKYKWYGIGKQPVVSCKQTLAIVQFFNSLDPHIYPIGLEVQMHSKKYGFTGTADLVLKDNRTGGVYIADFKTNETLTSDYKQKPLKIISPNHGLVQDSLGKYNIQLNLYSILLEDVGINATQRIIVHLRDDPETKRLYSTHRCLDIRSEIRPWLEENKYKL